MKVKQLRQLIEDAEDDAEIVISARVDVTVSHAEALPTYRKASAYIDQAVESVDADGLHLREHGLDDALSPGELIRQVVVVG